MNSGLLNPDARLMNSVEIGSLVPAKHHVLFMTFGSRYTCG